MPLAIVVRGADTRAMAGHKQVGRIRALIPPGIHFARHSREAACRSSLRRIAHQFSSRGSKPLRRGNARWEKAFHAVVNAVFARFLMAKICRRPLLSIQDSIGVWIAEN